VELLPLDFQGAHVQKTADQTMANANTFYALTWGEGMFDIGDWFNPANPTRLTAIETGLVRLTANTRVNQTGSTQFLLKMQKNGADTFGLPYLDMENTGVQALFGMSAPMAVNIGDYFETFGYYGTASGVVPAHINVFFTIEKLPSDLKYALVRRSANQTTTNSAWNTVLYDTEIADVGGWFNPASPGNFVVPAGITKVRVCANNGGSNITGDAALAMLKNGATVMAFRRENDTVGSDNNNAASCILDVVEGDVLTIIVWGQGTSAILDTAATWASIEEVRATDVY
jgi:hypothetical protein